MEMRRCKARDAPDFYRRVSNCLKRRIGMDRNHPGYKSEAEPFFSIVLEGLKDEVDGEHFWDAVADNAIFEFTYNFSGFTD